MRTVWRIFAVDFKRILRNPVAVVVTLGVALIPSLYAWFNIIANWDPYANTGSIRIAVANEDQGADSSLVGHLDAGQQVVDQLKSNTQLGWQFVDESTALDGVRSGDYYAAIVLPKDFSASLLGTIAGDSQRTTIQYYVNEKKNAIAPKITDTGANTIDEQVNASFVSTVSDTLAREIADAQGTAGDAADRTRRQAVGDLDAVISQLDSAHDAIASIADTASDAANAATSAKSTVTALQTQLNAVSTSLDRASTLLTDARTRTRSFAGPLDNAMNVGTARLSGLAADVRTAGDAVAKGFSDAQRTADDVAHTAGSAIDAQRAVRDTLAGLVASGGPIQSSDPLYGRIADQIARLDASIDAQQKQLDTFTSTSGAIIGAGAQAGRDFTGAAGDLLTGGITTINASRDSLNATVLPGLDSGLDSTASTAAALSGTIAGLQGTLSQSLTLLDQLSSTLAQTHDALTSTGTGLTGLRSTVASLRTDVAALDSSAVAQRLQSLGLDRADVGDYMSAPVKLDSKIIYPSSNYGSAVTPFYTNLALWVGGFVIIAIYKLELDRERVRQYSATQAYLGRWLLFVVVGAMQAVIVTVGDLVIGVQCEQPALFVLAGMLISFVYVNIIYALAATLRHIGKALAVVLVIVQIPGASGLYPIEMMPNFFRELKPWLPFTYGISAMRETIGGMYGMHYWQNLGVLLCYLPVALFVGLVVRRLSLNLNAMFDRRLLDTDLMITESTSAMDERVDLGQLFRAFMDSDRYRQKVRRRAERFFALYPRLIRSGLVLICVLPLGFLVLLFVIDHKMAMLVLWIMSIIVIDIYLIIVEYVRDRFARQLGMGALTPEQFHRSMASGFIGHHHVHVGRHGAGAVAVANGDASDDLPVASAAPAASASAPASAAPRRSGPRHARRETR